MIWQNRCVQLIIWVDSNQQSLWMPQENYQEASEYPMTCRSVGMVSFEDEDRVSLILNESALGTMNSQITIPKRAILCRKTILGKNELDNITLRYSERFG